MPREPLQPVAEQFTEWTNPLDDEQSVVLDAGGNNRGIRYTWKPGETKTLPSHHDRAIHRVHNGVVMGGLAPQLVRKGQTETVDPALDTRATARKEQEIAVARAAAAKASADDEFALAQKRSAEAAAKAKPRQGDQQQSPR